MNRVNFRNVGFPMTEVSLSAAVADCLEKVRGVRKVAEPLVEQVRSGERSRNFIVEVHDFLNSFGEVTEALDALPISDGVISVNTSVADRREAEKLFPVLINEVEALAGYQLEIIDALKKSVEKQGANMKSVRDARQMFEKFVKRPAQDAKFFDKKG